MNQFAPIPWGLKEVLTGPGFRGFSHVTVAGSDFCGRLFWPVQPERDVA